MKTILINIKKLCQIRPNTMEFVKGQSMADLPCIDNAFLLIENGKIADYGSMDNIHGWDISGVAEVIDAEGKMVLPAWADSHTHLVFAASREEEFVDKIKGLSYQEIAEKGGGILNSAKKLANCSEEELYDSAWERLQEIKATGTGAVEIKSGYGLSCEAELKILRVIKELKKHSDLTIKATFLGAHAFPAEFKENQNAYVDLVIEKMLPEIAKNELADFIDVFCENNYFSVAQMERIIDAGANFGLKAKVHVNQFNVLGGIKSAVNKAALSVDHLEVMSDEDITALKNSATMPTFLPSCSFFLNLPYGPAKKLIENDIPFALASDYNPGSTPSGNIPFVMSLAAINMKLLPEQSINACTLNSAYAMGLQKELGSITIGKKANLIITKTIPSLAYIPYSFGKSCIEKVILNK